MVKCALLKGKYGYYLSICRSEKQQPMLCQKASRGGRLFLYGEYYLRGICGGVGAGRVCVEGGPAGPAAAGGRTRPEAAEPAPAGAGCPAGHRVWFLRGRPRRVVGRITSSDGPGPPAGRRIAGRDRRPAGTGYTECCPQAGQSVRRWPKSPQRRLQYRRRRPAAARTR